MREQSAEVVALFERLDSSGVQLTALVNNAGAIPAGDILAIDEETWRGAWDLKVFGFVNMAREAYRRMKYAARGGVICNVIGAGGIRPTSGYICGATANAGTCAT